MCIDDLELLGNMPRRVAPIMVESNTTDREGSSSRQDKFSGLLTIAFCLYTFAIA
jgi:hypothetical protein